MQDDDLRGALMPKWNRYIEERVSEEAPFIHDAERDVWRCRLMAPDHGQLRIILLGQAPGIAARVRRDSYVTGPLPLDIFQPTITVWLGEAFPFQQVVIEAWQQRPHDVSTLAPVFGKLRAVAVVRMVEATR